MKGLWNASRNGSRNATTDLVLPSTNFADTVYLVEQDNDRISLSSTYTSINPTTNPDSTITSNSNTSSSNYHSIAYGSSSINSHNDIAQANINKGNNRFIIRDNINIINKGKKDNIISPIVGYNNVVQQHQFSLPLVVESKSLIVEPFVPTKQNDRLNNKQKQQTFSSSRYRERYQNIQSQKLEREQEEQQEESFQKQKQADHQEHNINDQCDQYEEKDNYAVPPPRPLQQMTMNSIKDSIPSSIRSSSSAKEIVTLHKFHTQNQRQQEEQHGHHQIGLQHWRCRIPSQVCLQKQEYQYQNQQQLQQKFSNEIPNMALMTIKSAGYRWTSVVVLTFMVLLFFHKPQTQQIQQQQTQHGIPGSSSATSSSSNKRINFLREHDFYGESSMAGVVNSFYTIDKRDMQQQQQRDDFHHQVSSKSLLPSHIRVTEDNVLLVTSEYIDTGSDSVVENGERTSIIDIDHVDAVDDKVDHRSSFVNPYKMNKSNYETIKDVSVAMRSVVHVNKTKNENRSHDSSRENEHLMLYRKRGLVKSLLESNIYKNLQQQEPLPLQTLISEDTISATSKDVEQLDKDVERKVSNTTKILLNIMKRGTSNNYEQPSHQATPVKPYQQNFGMASSNNNSVTLTIGLFRIIKMETMMYNDPLQQQESPSPLPESETLAGIPMLNNGTELSNILLTVRNFPTDIADEFKTEIALGSLFVFVSPPVSLVPGQDMDWFVSANTTITPIQRRVGNEPQIGNDIIIDKPSAPVIRTIGKKTLTVVRISTLDSSPTYSVEELRDTLFNPEKINLMTQFNLCSFGQLQWNLSEVAGIIDVTVNSTMDQFQYGSELTEAAQAVLIDKGTSSLPPIPNIATIADKVIMIVPPGTGHWVANSGVNHWRAQFNDVWVVSLTAMMHELGHAVGLQHSNENGIPYDDRTGYMSAAYPNSDGPQKCFNGMENYQLAWYRTRHRTITMHQLKHRPVINVRLAAFVDFDLTAASETVVLNIDDVLYLQYNRAKKFNVGTEEKRDQVTITTPDGSGSTCLGGMSVGDRFVIELYDLPEEDSQRRRYRYRRRTNTDGDTIAGMNVRQYTAATLPPNLYNTTSNSALTSPVLLVIDACEATVGENGADIFVLSVGVKDSSSSPSTCNQTESPTTSPTGRPTASPSMKPSWNPTMSMEPSDHPSTAPTNSPTYRPSQIPSFLPSTEPTKTFHPSVKPSSGPSSFPTDSPTTSHPSTLPSTVPSILPTASPTFTHSEVPTENPTGAPSISPSLRHSTVPTVIPTTTPTILPTLHHSTMPTSEPTAAPTTSPTLHHSTVPTEIPTAVPTTSPTLHHSTMPTDIPTAVPTTSPTLHHSTVPTVIPTAVPTTSPTLHHSTVPTVIPTTVPTTPPTLHHSTVPTVIPTTVPTTPPTLHRSAMPTSVPTGKPTISQTTYPSDFPSTTPTIRPTKLPTLLVSYLPSYDPTIAPTMSPTMLHSDSPSVTPIMQPTMSPTLYTSGVPSTIPSISPMLVPSFVPSDKPSATPTMVPTSLPTLYSSDEPSIIPTLYRSYVPTIAPSDYPIILASDTPTSPPSASTRKGSSTISPSIRLSRGPTFIPSIVPSTPASDMISRSPTVNPSLASSVDATSGNSDVSSSISPHGFTNYFTSDAPSDAATIRSSRVFLTSDAPESIVTLSSAEPSERPSLGPTSSLEMLDNGRSDFPTFLPINSSSEPKLPSGHPTSSPVWNPSNDKKNDIIALQSDFPSQSPSTQSKRSNFFDRFKLRDNTTIPAVTTKPDDRIAPDVLPLYFNGFRFKSLFKASNDTNASNPNSGTTNQNMEWLSDALRDYRRSNLNPLKYQSFRDHTHSSASTYNENVPQVDDSGNKTNNERQEQYVSSSSTIDEITRDDYKNFKNKVIKHRKTFK